MGLFDRFKKNSNSNIDLNNPLIKKMVEWIEHPMEFNKKPETAIILDQRELFWPSQKKEICALIKFTVDNNEYIGFTGPTTWCFIGIDFKKLTIEQLYERYTGWFIAFFTKNSESYQKSLEGTNEKVVFDQLYRNGYDEIRTIENVYLGKDNYYEFIADEGGRKIRVVGVENDLNEFEMDYILPFYEYIGIGWNPLDK
jgi:hypothetical protein